MDVVTNHLHGFAVALTPFNLFWCFVGVFLGTVVGVLPGLGPPATIAMLLPLTYQMNPTSAIIMLAGIYYGAKYGGSRRRHNCCRSLKDCATFCRPCRT
jgi:putative tricarboxylic transport membrane protein